MIYVRSEVFVSVMVSNMLMERCLEVRRHTTLNPEGSGVCTYRGGGGHFYLFMFLFGGTGQFRS